MKENIIKDVIEIRVSSLIELLCVPFAVHMQSIRYLESQGYSRKEIQPNRERIGEYLGLAFDGYIVDEFGTNLDLKGLDIEELLWAKDYLELYYLNMKAIKPEQLPSNDEERTALRTGVPQEAQEL